MSQPSGGGPFPVVVVFQHIGGQTETMRLVARHVAEAGYCCVMPDLYYRLGTIVLDPQSRDETVLALMKLARGSQDNAKIMQDTAALLRVLDADPFVISGSAMGCLGYGPGGGFGFLAAGTFPDRFVIVAAVLGVGFMLDTPDSPHIQVARSHAEVYCGFAGIDDIIPATAPKALEESLARTCLAYKVEVHPGVRHGYCFADRAVYDARAAGAEWAQIFAMFGRHLPPPKPDGTGSG